MATTKKTKSVSSTIKKVLSTKPKTLPSLANTGRAYLPTTIKVMHGRKVLLELPCQGAIRNEKLHLQIPTTVVEALSRSYGSVLNVPVEVGAVSYVNEKLGD